jgi:hypothetical protein
MHAFESQRSGDERLGGATIQLRWQHIDCETNPFEVIRKPLVVDVLDEFVGFPPLIPFTRWREDELRNQMSIVLDNFSINERSVPIFLHLRHYEISRIQ